LVSFVALFPYLSSCILVSRIQLETYDTEILVVGGGAAGFFAAIHAKASKPAKRVHIIEKSNKVLAKVLISGGGRCNVTYNEPDLTAILEHYPRGRGILKWAIRKWGVTNTMRWFGRNGVPLKVEEDGRIFPVSDSSASIAGCLTSVAARLGVTWETHTGLKSIKPLEGGGFEALTETGNTIRTSVVLLACGGFPKLSMFSFITDLGIEVEPPVPSIFTFNIADPSLHALKGVSVPWGKVRVAGMDAGNEKGWFSGPILITHWGLSGPAVLKSSAWLARELAACNYSFTVLVDWSGLGEEKGRSLFEADLLMNSAKKIVNVNPFTLPSRLWEYLIVRAGINSDTVVRDLAKTDKNRLLEQCIRCLWQAEGKTTFKEEFVTAGGVASHEVDKDTLECRKVPGLYFAGEILDIDGVTGGFNFQAAWSTGYVAGVRAAEKA
jgi:predicted Rossmann fold flavoprotein